MGSIVRPLTASEILIFKPRMQSVLARILLYLGAAALLFFLSACSTGPRVANHSFSFNAMSDSPDILILDYRYGNSKTHALSANPFSVKRGTTRQATNVFGPILVGEDLYVKWQIKSTGAIHEDTVDLKTRLPRNMTDHRVYFVVKGGHLYVYLVTPQKRSPEEPEGPLRMYSDLRVHTIYPGQPEF